MSGRVDTEEMARKADRRRGREHKRRKRDVRESAQCGLNYYSRSQYDLETGCYWRTCARCGQPLEYVAAAMLVPRECPGREEPRRALSRHIDQRHVLEVNRLATDGTRWHLPAVAPSGALSQVMVTACGKRGPMRPREDLGTRLVQTSNGAVEEAPLVCEKCLVRWDEVEEKGGLLVRWVSTFSRTWAAAGAVLFVDAPPHVCSECRERRRDYVAIMVMARL